MINLPEILVHLTDVFHLGLFYPQLQSPRMVKIKSQCNAVEVIRFVPFLPVRNDWNVLQEVAIFKDFSFWLSYLKYIFQTEYRQHWDSAFKEGFAGYSCVFSVDICQGSLTQMGKFFRSSVGLLTEKWILDNIETAEIRLRSPECSVIYDPKVQK